MHNDAKRNEQMFECPTFAQNHFNHFDPIIKCTHACVCMFSLNHFNDGFDHNFKKKLAYTKCEPFIRFIQNEFELKKKKKHFMLMLCNTTISVTCN